MHNIVILRLDTKTIDKGMTIKQVQHLLGHTKLYLKTELENYYEKFGSVYIVK